MQMPLAMLSCCFSFLERRLMSLLEVGLASRLGGLVWPTPVISRTGVMTAFVVGVGTDPLVATRSVSAVAFKKAMEISVYSGGNGHGGARMRPQSIARDPHVLDQIEGIRLDASMARRISSVNMILGPFHEAATDRSGSPRGRPGHKAKPHRCGNWRSRLMPGCASWFVRSVQGPLRPLSISTGSSFGDGGPVGFSGVDLRRRGLLVVPATRNGRAPAGHGMSAGRHG